MKSLYDILNVSSTATPREIRKAYHRLAIKYHPDKHHGDPQFECVLKEINAAYEILSDPVKRSEYDLTLFNSRWERAKYSQADASEDHQRTPSPGVDTNKTVVTPRGPGRFFRTAVALTILAAVIWLFLTVVERGPTDEENRPNSGELKFRNSN